MNFKSIIKIAIALPVLILMVQIGTANAQNWGELTFQGQALENGEPLKGALVTIYQDPYGKDDYWPVDQFMTAGNAKFKVKLDYNSAYIIEVGAEGGYVKTFFIETDMLPGLLTENTTFEASVDFAKIKHLEDLNTTARVTFDEGSDQFSFDKNDAILQQASGQ